MLARRDVLRDNDVIKRADIAVQANEVGGQPRRDNRRVADGRFTPARVVDRDFRFCPLFPASFFWSNERRPVVLDGVTEEDILDKFELLDR